MFFSLLLHVAQSHTGKHRWQDTGETNKQTHMCMYIYPGRYCLLYCVDLDRRSFVWCDSPGDDTEVRLAF